MRNRLLLTELAAGICLVGFASTVRGDLRWVEDVGVIPTASVVELPRTYLVPSSYVSSRTYVSPTSVVLPATTTANVYDVVPTTYYVPSSYVSTRSYRAFRPRRYRYMEASYVSSYPSTLIPTYYVTPSTYLAPTSFIVSTGLMATSANLCCESALPVVRVAPMSTGTPSTREYQKSADAYEARPGTMFNSAERNEPDYRTDANKPVRDGFFNTTNGSTDPQTSSGSLRNALPSNSSVGRQRETIESTPGSGASNSSASTESNQPTSSGERPVVSSGDRPVVIDPAPTQSGATVKQTPAPSKPANVTSKKAAAPDLKALIPPPVATPPIVPEPEATGPLDIETPPDNLGPALPLPKPDEGSRRDSQKPAYPSATILRSRRNVLEGTIVSADSLDPEENVEVVISDRTGRYGDKTSRTNAFGQFAVSLPEGEWSINLTMPSGRVLAVAQGGITANAGRIIDMYGRDLKKLVIKR